LVRQQHQAQLHVSNNNNPQSDVSAAMSLVTPEGMHPQNEPHWPQNNTLDEMFAIQLESNDEPNFC